jgi:hypothetical protein
MPEDGTCPPQLVYIESYNGNGHDDLESLHHSAALN